ncbi:Protein CBG09905 [Caenorhabditis briggsae]|uniref:Uncharacterized protein n=2 Tax=Caenorhabditis briggsae TaxID=6238 RepID=A0AAE9EI56_CAEBR|nr:Protein CBG09905 [Caenorhabditis briggsae]ULU01726.1 hypothetical protein L3Y34_001784 [Caenorhabditis briggsae]UMM24357.1 hypothetical protein L5515_004624 [Caenorhabditis briggsae]CAP29444.1 Protein CBG09905 [Caenorhabditis briggsae]
MDPSQTTPPSSQLSIWLGLVRLMLDELFQHRPIFNQNNLGLFWCFHIMAHAFAQYRLDLQHFSIYATVFFVYGLLVIVLSLKVIKALRFVRALTLVCFYLLTITMVVQLLTSISRGNGLQWIITDLAVNFILIAALAMQYIILNETVISQEIEHLIDNVPLV